MGRFGPLLSVRRIGQFVSVGVVGALAETAVVLVVTTLGGLAPLLAKGLGAELSISLMFLLNDRITFASDAPSSPLAVCRRWCRSHLVRIGGLSVAFVILWVLTTKTTITVVVNGADLWPTIANLIGIGCSLVLNYCAESIYTWNVTDSNPG